MISNTWIQYVGPTLVVPMVPWGYDAIPFPAMTRSMHSALSDLKLDRLFVVYPGDAQFPLHDRVDAVGLIPACTDGL